MKVLILTKDRVFARMLSLEISAYGADTKILCEISTDARHIASVSDMTILDADLFCGTEYFPELERTQVILFGYSESIKNVTEKIPSGFRVITRPFSVQEFLLSIFEKNEETLIGVHQIKRQKSAADALILNEKNKTVSYKKEKIELTKTEFSLLVFLIKNKGRTVSREEIAQNVWGGNFSKNTNIVDVYVRYLREKLDEKLGIKIISTVRGVGYTIKAE